MIFGSELSFERFKASAGSKATVTDGLQRRREDHSFQRGAISAYLVGDSRYPLWDTEFGQTITAEEGKPLNRPDRRRNLDGGKRPLVFESFTSYLGNRLVKDNHAFPVFISIRDNVGTECFRIIGFYDLPVRRGVPDLIVRLVRCYDLDLDRTHPGKVVAGNGEGFGRPFLKAVPVFVGDRYCETLAESGRRKNKPEFCKILRRGTECHRLRALDAQLTRSGFGHRDGRDSSNRSRHGCLPGEFLAIVSFQADTGYGDTLTVQL